MSEANKRNERGEIGLEYISKNLYNPKIIVGKSFVRIEIDGLGSLDPERVTFFGDDGFINDGIAVVTKNVSLFKLTSAREKLKNAGFRTSSVFGDIINIEQTSKILTIKFGILETNE